MTGFAMGVIMTLTGSYVSMWSNSVNVGKSFGLFWGMFGMAFLYVFWIQQLVYSDDPVVVASPDNAG